MRILKYAALVFLTIFITGCNKPPYCKDKCSKAGEIRDAFCECFDPSKTSETSGETGGPSPNTGSSSIIAQCICPYSSGIIGAYFNYKPSAYAKFSPVKIYASSCANLTLCERIKNDDGSETQPFLTGTLRLQPQTWNTYDNFLTGSTLYYVLGRALPQASIIEDWIPKDRLIPRITRFALGNILRMRRYVHSAQFVNDFSSCNAACSAGNSAYCLSDNVPGNVGNGLRKLIASLASIQDGVIRVNDVRNYFGIQDDECGRSDTTLASGRFENGGGACNITSYITGIDVSVNIFVPPFLAGSIQHSGSELMVEFPDKTTAPVVKLGDPLLNADWGGTVKNIAGGNGYVRFGIGEQSCIEAKF